MLFHKKDQENAPEKAASKGNSHYLTAKESREIAKSNSRIIRELEKRKKRHATEADYL